MAQNRINDSKINIDKNSNKNTNGKSYQLEQENSMNLICHFQEIYEAIIKDDVWELESLLKKHPNFDINLPFDYRNDYTDMLICHTKNDKLKISVPFHLAVVSASTNVAEWFLKRGVDVMKLDTCGMNASVLHSCVTAAFRSSEIEEKIAQMIPWLEAKINHDKLLELVNLENDDGFRPLEYAIQQGTLRIAKKMLYLNGYVTFEKKQGPRTFKLHDITEYENGDRITKSPVHMLAYLDESMLKEDHLHDIVLDPLIQSWVDGKLKSSALLVVIWICLWLFMFVMYLLVDNNSTYIYEFYGSNTTNLFCQDLMELNTGHAFFYFSAAMTLFLCIITIIWDFIASAKWLLEKQYLKCYDLNGIKSPMGDRFFYFFTQELLLFCMVIVTLCFVRTYTDHETISIGLHRFVYLVRIFIPLLMFWSTSYFLQFVPSIGARILTLKSMLMDLLSFMFILALSTFFFTYAFQIFALGNSTIGCVPEFSNPLESAFTLFQMLLNMYDAPDGQFHNPGIFNILFVIYGFFASILVLNFLIAIMSDTADVDEGNQKVHLKMNQLAIIVLLEERLFWVGKFLYKRLRKMGFYHKDGKIYLVSVTEEGTGIYDNKDIVMD